MNTALIKAIQDALDMCTKTGKKVHLIRTHTNAIGYENMPESFTLDRQYYHSNGGQKMFFTHILTVHNNPN